MTTPDDILAAVVSAPHEDLPRLLYAECLEDRGGPGDAERAGYIRDSFNAAKPGPGRRAMKMRKAAYLQRQCGGTAGTPFGLPLGSGVTVWLAYNGTRRPDKLRHLPQCVGIAIADRGFVTEVRLPYRAFLGGECWRCEGSQFVPCVHCDENGYRPDGFGVNHCHECDGPGSSRQMPCPECKATGRVPGLAAELCALHPLTRVVATDREPTDYGRGDGSAVVFWEPGILQPLPHQLPFGVAVAGGWAVDFPMPGLMAYPFANRKAANDALSVVMVNIGRKWAGLKELPSILLRPQRPVGDAEQE